jgi:hypothetical protein
MKRIIINERQEKKLLSKLVKESINPQMELIKNIANFLDSNFVRASESKLNDSGQPIKHGIVIRIDSNKKPLQYLEDVDLFFLLQQEYSKSIQDSKKRDELIKNVIKQWYNKEKMLKNGILTV